MTFADACRTAFWLLLAGRDLRRRADREWIRARAAGQAPALPPSDAGVAGHRPLEVPPSPTPEQLAALARQLQAAQDEVAFRATHPDYDAVLARAGIWHVILLVQQGAPLVPGHQHLVDMLRAAPNPAEVAYGLALTRIATGETA